MFQYLKKQNVATTSDQNISYEVKCFYTFILCTTTVKDHEINNVTSETDHVIMIYNGTTNEVYIDKQERTKPRSSSKRNTDDLDIHVAKLKQKIKKK